MRFGPVALACALLVAPATISAQDAPDQNLALGQVVFARYDSAFLALELRARSDTTAYAWLLELARFKAQRVGWGVEQSGTIRAVTRVRRDAYLVVVPTDDPAYKRMGSIMETDSDASVRATRVKADTIAAEWAAIFLAFELSHIRDDLLGLLSENATQAEFAASSRRAYSAEYLAARVLAGPVLEQHLDSVLSALAPGSVKDLAAGLSPVLRQSFERFDAIVSPQRALTEREEQRRAGVYAVGLLLRFSELNQVADLEFGSALRCIGGCK